MSAVGLAMVALGAMLVYAGYTGESLVSAVQGVITGKKSTPATHTGTGTGSANAAEHDAAGGSGSSTPATSSGTGTGSANAAEHAAGGGS